MVQKTEEAEPKAAKPEGKPKPAAKSFSQEEMQAAVSAATSKYQQDAAEARKGQKEIGKQIKALEAQIAEAKQEAEVARLAGDDVEEADRVRERLKLQKELDKREIVVKALEHKASLTILSGKYGIPSKDLEDAETFDEMEKIAKDYYIGQLEAARDARLAESNGAEPERKPGFDVGAPKGSPGQTDYMKMALSTKPEDGAKFEEMVRRAKSGKAR